MPWQLQEEGRRHPPLSHPWYLLESPSRTCPHSAVFCLSTLLIQPLLPRVPFPAFLSFICLMMPLFQEAFLDFLLRGLSSGFSWPVIEPSTYHITWQQSVYVFIPFTRQWLL